MRVIRLFLSAVTMVLVSVVSSAVVADDAAVRSGDTAWLMTSTALVLFMTIPGLALFYAGMVRAKNAVSVMMQCFAIAGLVSILWVLYGYSVAFGGRGALSAAVDEHVLNLTISTGVILYREGEKVEETLSRADAGVYQAKDGGRNKVVLVS